MERADLTLTKKELEKLIKDEQNTAKTNAIISSCFAFASAGQFTMAMFHPDIANFIVAGGFAIFSGVNARLVYNHYNKEQNYKEIKNKIYTKTK